MSPHFTVEKSGSGLSQTTDLNSVTEGWNYTQDKLLLLKLQHDESVVEFTSYMDGHYGTFGLVEAKAIADKDHRTTDLPSGHMSTFLIRVS